MIVKGVNIPNEWIDEMCEKLEISIDEAVELYLTDVGAIENEEQNELDKKAKAVKVNHNAQSEKPKKRAPRKREPNVLKREIINLLVEAINVNGVTDIDFDTLKVRNCEKYIDFTADGREFTINLVEHRPPKKK